MPCDKKPRNPNQSLSARVAEAKAAIESLDRLILKRRVRPVVGPQGAITFQGWETNDRAQVSDACAYRRLMSTGSALARAEIARAEALAGVSVDRKVLTQGVHSHDGGRTWGRD